jgi:hypothetical protein
MNKKIQFAVALILALIVTVVGAMLMSNLLS